MNTIIIPKTKISYIIPETKNIKKHGMGRLHS